MQNLRSIKLLNFVENTIFYFPEVKESSVCKFVFFFNLLERDSIIKLMLLFHLSSFWLKDNWEPSNQVGSLKLSPVFSFFYKMFEHLKNLWKRFLLRLKSSLWFSINSNFCIPIFVFFLSSQPLLEKITEDKSQKFMLSSIG